MLRTGKCSQHSSIVLPICLNGRVFVYKQSGFKFEPICSHLIYRFRNSFQQGVSWHSGNYRVCEKRTWHDNKTKSKYSIQVSTPKKAQSFGQWLNDLLLLQELNGCRFESICTHLISGFCTCFKRGVSWYSGNYSVCIYSEMGTWHDKNIQSKCMYI